jgi:hydrogenase-4 component F
MLIALLILVPIAAGLLSLAVGTARFALSALVATAAVHTVVTAAIVATEAPSDAGGVFALDAPGRFFLSILSVLFALVTLYTVSFLMSARREGTPVPRHFVPCLLWFLASMTVVAATQHLAVLWAAIEATTLASAPLVYFHKRRGALEATWKYLLICSVGIALALLGTFLLGVAASASPSGGSSLLLSSLQEAAPAMARPWLKAAFVFVLVGYGTKMGLVPMHTWLPDTHSQAPSPVSALLSGAVLNCALLGILRVYQVCLASGDAAFARHLLLVLGLVSVGVACAFMVGQRDYKRQFAYSSIENMGIVAVGVGLGGAATYGAMLHALNHSMCKAGLFFVAGNLLRAFKTSAVHEVRGALRRIPVTAGLLIALCLAIGGIPPFGPFMSELMIFRAAMTRAGAAFAVPFLCFLAIGFLGLSGVAFSMVQGEPSRDSPAAREPWPLLAAPSLALACSLVLGVYVPPFIAHAIEQTSRLLGD